jgi:hypothetical protein
LWGLNPGLELKEDKNVGLFDCIALEQKLVDQMVEKMILRSKLRALLYLIAIYNSIFLGNAFKKFLEGYGGKLRSDE